MLIKLVLSQHFLPFSRLFNFMLRIELRLPGFEAPFHVATCKPGPSGKEKENWEQRWRNGENTRYHCGDTICGWIKLLLIFPFVLSGLSPATSAFLSKQKPAFSNSNSTRNTAKMWICILVYLPICLFIHLDATICHSFHPPYFFFFFIYF